MNKVTSQVTGFNKVGCLFSDFLISFLRMLGFACNLLRRRRLHTTAQSHCLLKTLISPTCLQERFGSHITGSASSPSLSIWRRKKEMGKEGLIVAKELKRLQSKPIQLERFIQSNVSRLLKSDLFAVLAEFQRQNLVFLSMKV